MAVAVLERDHALAAPEPLPGLGCRGPVVRMNELRDRPAQQLFLRVAEQIGPCRIDALEVAVGPGHAQRVR